jgi:hypothetical protein
MFELNPYGGKRYEKMGTVFPFFEQSFGSRFAVRVPQTPRKNDEGTALKTLVGSKTLPALL